MKRFIDKYINPRFGYDAWAVKANGTLLKWTTSTTREECRALIDSLRGRNQVQMDMFGEYVYTPVKVKIIIEEHH